jgi:hypothetical protein
MMVFSLRTHPLKSRDTQEPSACPKNTGAEMGHSGTFWDFSTKERSKTKVIHQK